MVTPRKIAAAKAAALSFFPPLAALTACMVAAAFCLSPFSVNCGDLFFFFGAFEDFFFLAEEGVLGGRGAAGLLVPDLVVFEGFVFFEALDFPGGGCDDPYSGGGPLGWGWCGGG